MSIISKIKNKIRWEYKKYKLHRKPKIFCVGRNKTGTTSFKKAFKNLNYAVGQQHTAEKLIREYKAENFQSIIDYCKTAQVFQDIPFSLPETYKHLDRAFPDAKFVLTIRTSAEECYESYIRHQKKIYGKDGEMPTKEDLKKSKYVWKGWSWEVKNVLRTLGDEDDIYNKEHFIKTYKEHNKNVKEYFKNRPDKLLVINVSEPESYNKLMEFLNIDSPYIEFPWENKTNN